MLAGGLAFLVITLGLYFGGNKAPGYLPMVANGNFEIYGETLYIQH